MHKINNIESTSNVLKSILEAIQGIKNCLQLLPIFNENSKNYFYNFIIIMKIFKIIMNVLC